MPNKPATLSKGQLAILELLATGEWELGWYSGIDSSARIQKGGIGKGGEAKDVNMNTFGALKDKGYVIKDTTHNDWRVSKWVLTTRGREKYEQAKGSSVA